MLTNDRDHSVTEGESAFLSVHNYLETVVLTAINGHTLSAGLSREALADVACIALNHLPPRYVRHDVDTLFYMDQAELAAQQQKVDAALNDAFAYVKDRL